MHYYPERRLSKAAAWSRRLGAFAAMMLLIATVAHRMAILETAGFIPVMATVAAIALAALVMAALGFSRLWNHGDKGGRNIVMAVLFASLVLGPFGYALYQALTLPMLTDVATDLEDPPRLAAAAQTRTSDMNAIAAFTAEQRRLQSQNYPLVTGRRYEMPFGRVLDTVLGMVAERGWTVLTPSPDPAEEVEATIEATGRTMLLGFPFDVAIRLTDEETSTYVDMRSASRYGRHDLGANAARIRGFLSELDMRISALAGVVPAEPEIPESADRAEDGEEAGGPAPQQ